MLRVRRQQKRNTSGRRLVLRLRLGFNLPMIYVWHSNDGSTFFSRFASQFRCFYWHCRGSLPPMWSNSKTSSDSESSESSFLRNSKHLTANLFLIAHVAPLLLPPRDSFSPPQFSRRGWFMLVEKSFFLLGFPFKCGGGSGWELAIWE